MNRSLTVPSKPVLNLLVAHMPEAKPLIKQFALQPIARSPHPLFGNEDGIYLTVSGNGSRAMTLACAHLAGRQQEVGQAPAWLNIGIAGHGSEPVGAGLLINKIINKQQGKSYYPSPSINGLPVSALQTVNRVERVYKDPHAYDMEGSAFWESATFYGQLDFVQLFKIVSDNPEQHVDDFDLHSIPGLIAEKMEEIAEVALGLHSLAREYLQIHDLPDEFYELTRRVNFTATQSSQLQKLFQRWTAFGKREQLLEFLATHCDQTGGSKQILLELAAELQRLEAGSVVG